MKDLLSWPLVIAAVVVYFIGLAVYRLILHPLSRFPGPKLAALTRYYEAYFDLIRNGQYTFKIAELHKRYGPIIRISPYELHVSDPVFFNTLYRQDAGYDKYDWIVDAFALRGASITTAAHHIHRARRQPMSPFFSKAKVTSRLDLIYLQVDKLCHRLSKYAEAEAGTAFDFGAAMTAFTRDVANNFILGRSDNSLDKDDFDVAMVAASQGLGQVWHITKFVRWAAPAMQAMPKSWIMRFASKGTKVFFRRRQENQRETKDLMAAVASPTTKDKGPRTIVHEIMDSKLPPSEKTFDRVFTEVTTVTGAGFETTASVLRLIFFHIFSQAEIVQRLRAELASAGAVLDHPLDVKTLEQLPYLTAVLTEGLRMSPGIATRMTRVAPDTDLFYEQWRIPAGTPVGMTTLLMHMDETLYPEPRRFNPDRWMDASMRKKTDGAFAPFSKGTRNCLGMHLAWAEMYIFLADLAQRFDFHFEEASAEDFECESDQFAIGTKGKGVLKATIAYHRA